MDTLTDLFPHEVMVMLDEERPLRLCIRGWQFLEDVFGNMDGVFRRLAFIQEPWEQVPEDLLLFVYACLRDAGGKAPLTVPQLQQLALEGADCASWRDGVAEAVYNFFPARPGCGEDSRPWSWSWAAWIACGVCGRSQEQFMAMSIREIVALADGRAIDSGVDKSGDNPQKPKGVPITPADFGPDGQFRPRRDGEE